MYRALIAAALASTMLSPRGSGDSASEPPLRMLVQIDGKDHECVDGRPVQLEIGGKLVAVKVSVQPLRHFDAEGLSFDYPRDMGFELEESEDGPIWTLDGNDCVLIVFRSAEEEDPREAAEGFLAGWTETVDPDAEEPTVGEVSWEEPRVRASARAFKRPRRSSS